MLRRNLHAGFSSGVFNSTVLLAQVNLLCQRDDSVGPASGWPHRLQLGHALSTGWPCWLRPQHGGVQEE
jgi:hypothetical protein